MSEVKVPSWFESKFLDDEKVISKYKYFYATNKRLIRSKSDSDFNFLNYDKVQVTIKRSIGLNIILFTAGITLIWGGLLSPDIQNLEFLNDFMILVGIGMIAVLFLGGADYQISFLKDAPTGLSSYDKTQIIIKWQIMYDRFGRKKVLRFGNRIQELSNNPIIFKKPSAIRIIIALLPVILWFAFIIWITGMMFGIFPIPP